MKSVAIRTHSFATDPEGDLVYCNGMPGSSLVSYLIPFLRPHVEKLHEPIQEDYGWGVWCEQERFAIWVSVSHAGGSQNDAENIPEWVISATHEPGLSLRQWFGRGRGRQIEAELFKVILELFKSQPKITIARVE